jgi:hypothetical protein
MDSGLAPAARPGMTTPHKLPKNCQITSSTTIIRTAIVSFLPIAHLACFGARYYPRHPTQGKFP